MRQTGIRRRQESFLPISRKNDKSAVARNPESNCNGILKLKELGRATTTTPKALAKCELGPYFELGPWVSAKKRSSIVPPSASKYKHFSLLRFPNKREPGSGETSSLQPGNAVETAAANPMDI